MPVLQMFVDADFARDQLLYQISRDMVPPHPGPDGENHLCLCALCTVSPAAKKHAPICHLLGPAADVQGKKPPPCASPLGKP